MYKRIDEAFEKVLFGVKLSKQEIVELLKIDTYSDECTYLRTKANDAGRILTDNKAYMWGAIGLDYASCAANCGFCSFGSAWELIETEEIFTSSMILSKVKEYVDNQVHFIVLRTTQYYLLDTLMEYVQTIRKEIEGDYEIIVNVGEFDIRMAHQMYENGVNGVYHAIRLREGIDTHFDVKQRLETLSAVHQSQLNLIHLVEPVGVEHSYEEIADRFLCSLAYGTYISGIMARIPVKGTPLGDKPQLSDEEVAKMIAVLRLAGGRTVHHICVHPASELAIQSGANVVVIETGAIPRDQALITGKWKNFDYKAAKDLFMKNNFQVVS